MKNEVRYWKHCIGTGKKKKKVQTTSSLTHTTQWNDSVGYLFCISGGNNWVLIKSQYQLNYYIMSNTTLHYMHKSHTHTMHDDGVEACGPAGVTAVIQVWSGLNRGMAWAQMMVLSSSSVSWLTAMILVSCSTYLAWSCMKCGMRTFSIWASAFSRSTSSNDTWAHRKIEETELETCWTSNQKSNWNEAVQKCKHNN